MVIRAAGEADLEILRGFVEEYLAEFWQRPFPPEPVTDEWLRRGRTLVAEEDGEIVGMAKGVAGGTGHVSLVYVRPERRRRGIGTALLRELAAWFREQGIAHVTLGVETSNHEALAAWRRLGFVEYRRELASPLGELERRLGDRQKAPSFGSIHVQTDDVSAVERAVRQFVPRLPGRSQGSVVRPPRNGWVAVYDDVCDRDPKQLRRLSRELSDRMGAVVLTIGVEERAVVRFVLFERGRVMDEYLSVQEYYGPLPPGDVVALAANPTVVARLTGADPAAVRAAALHASSPDELPPPAELATGIAQAMGIEGAEHGYTDALALADAVRIERD